MDSLSKQLEGGNIKVRKRGSNVTKRHGKRGGYSNYLERHTVKQKSVVSEGGSKVVSLVNKKRSNRKPSKKKKKSGPPEIPIIIPKQAKSAPAKLAPAKLAPAKPAPAKPAPAPAKSTPAKPDPTKPAKSAPAKPAKPVKQQNKGALVANPGKPLRRTNKRLSHRSNRRKGKRVSVTRTSKLTDKDVSKIQGKIKNIKQKGGEDIKKELEKDGIKVSGKSPSILKDIYLYSKLCGINITRE